MKSALLVFVLGGTALGGAAADTASCCELLRKSGLKHVYFPRNPVYTERVDSYWSLTSQLTPRCFVQPESTQDVSTIVKTLVNQTQCEFAIRSGGHSSNAGWNNIEDGVTIDLGLMNGTSYDSSTSLASILPGTRWLSVYRTLDPLDRALAGGRLGTVGVGGYLTGGGLSHYVYRYGLACDNVKAFEVVLANGTIIEATATQNADLFQALKGGSSNFGIVTRYDVQTYLRQPLWGGIVEYHENASAAFVPAIKTWTDRLEDYDVGSAVIFWMYKPALKQTIIYAGLVDTTGNVVAPAFDPFLRIPGNISANSSLSMANMSELALGTQAAGYRDIWFTLTMRNDEALIAKAIQLHATLVEEMKRDSSDGDFETQCFFQPFPTIVGKRGVEKGGNILGIDRLTENAVVLLGSLAVNGVDQERMGRERMLAWKREQEEYAATMNGLFEYQYLNYADGSQDVTKSYGIENLQKMKEVSSKYDPLGVFQKRVPGGFKLSK